jgi:hypothetical protein
MSTLFSAQDPGDVNDSDTSTERITQLEQRMTYLEVLVARLVHELQGSNRKHSDPYAPVSRSGVEL